MQTVQLREGEATRADTLLDGTQLEILRRAGVDVRPFAGPGSQPGTSWEFRPGSQVGVFRCGDLNIAISPRFPIDRVMFLVGYSLGPGDWASSPLPLAPGDDILEAIVPAFVRLTQDAISRGLLQAYRSADESASMVRGRIRMADQLRNRYGLTVPVEVAYDEFTEDIEENRLLKAAIGHLWRMPIRSAEARRELGALRPAFSTVSSIAYQRKMVPEVEYTRLNLRYRPAVELARLIIGSSPVDLAPGDKTGTTFLVDMDQVFEGFLRVALRQALGLSESDWPTSSPFQRALHLEEERQVRVDPGLSWWRGRRCLFVGEARYSGAGRGLHRQSGVQDDIYRMLAYCTAAGLPSGLLVYPDDVAEPAVHRIRNSDKAIEVATLDLDGTPREILTSIEVLAERVQAHREGSVVAA